MNESARITYAAFPPALKAAMKIAAKRFDWCPKTWVQQTEAIAEAMHWMAFQAGWIVEGGGSVGVAAILSGAVQLDERPTAAVISGGNVDEETLRKVLSGKD